LARETGTRPAIPRDFAWFVRRMTLFLLTEESFPERRIVLGNSRFPGRGGRSQG